MTITVALTFDRIVIYFDDVPHLSLQRDKLLGFQSWKDYGGKRYVIEWTLDGASISTEYDSAEKWASILQQVDALLSPAKRS